MPLTQNQRSPCGRTHWVAEGATNARYARTQIREHRLYPLIIAPEWLAAQLGKDREDRSMPDILTQLFKRGVVGLELFLHPLLLVINPG